MRASLVSSLLLVLVIIFCPVVPLTITPFLPCAQCGANVARGSAALRDDGRFYCSDCDHNLSASAQHHANADRDTRPSPTTKAPPKVASEPLVSFPDESDEEEN